MTIPTDNGLSIQLARLESKLDGTGQRLDDFSNRMDRFEEQRDLDRKELQVICGQIAGITATYQLHVEQTNAATAAASAAMREAAAAKSTALQVESSWNDLRKMTRPAGSAEYKSVTKALEERAQRKEQDRESLEAGVVNIVLKTFEARDQAERENRRQEAKLLLDQNEDRRKDDENRRKRVTWIVGLVMTAISTLSGAAYWNLHRQSQEDRQQFVRFLDSRRNNNTHDSPQRTSKPVVTVSPIE